MSRLSAIVVEVRLQIDRIIDNINMDKLRVKYKGVPMLPRGPPSKYYVGPTMLNFRDETTTRKTWDITLSKNDVQIMNEFTVLLVVRYIIIFSAIACLQMVL